MEDKKRQIYKELQMSESFGTIESGVYDKKRPILFISDLSFAPPTDVWETGKEICVLMEIPGLRSDDFSISYNGGYLIIEGHRPEPAQRSGSKITKIHKKEIDFGRFRVKVKINTRICQEDISANYRDGFLLVKLVKDISAGKERDVEIPVRND